MDDIEESQLHNIGDDNDDFEYDPTEKAKSIYSINNVTTYVPMQQDVNCISTVKDTVLYYVGIVSRCLNNAFGLDIDFEFSADDR